MTCRAAMLVVAGLLYGTSVHASVEATAPVSAIAQSSSTPNREAPAYPTYIGIRINGELAAENALLLRGGKSGELFYLAQKEVAAFRFALPTSLAPTKFDDQSFFLMNDIAGIRLQFDEVSQVLSIDAAATMFLPANVALAPARQRPIPSASVGSFLSYDLYTQRASSGNRNQASGGQFEWGVFSPFGVLSNTFFANHTETSRQTTRLDTLFTIDQPTSLTSIRIGDTITQNASWSTPALFAGIQYTTNFGTQPGFVTYPLNSLSGQTALPSVVDVYVNNVLTATQRVQQGPFTLNDLPNINGRGEIRLIVRDLLGREQAIVQSLYGSTQLLRAGLNDFSLQAGTLRENYGITSNNYGRGFASGVWRRGITDGFTAESGFELARGRQLVGIGASWLAGAAGEFSTSVAHSRQDAETIVPEPFNSVGTFTPPNPLTSRAGRSLAARWDWRSSQITVGSQLRITTSGFRSIGNGIDGERPRREMSVFGSVGTDWGSIALGLTQIDRTNQAETKLAQISWSKSFGRWGQLSLNGFASLTGATNQSVSIGYFLPLNFTSSVGTSATRITSTGRSRVSSNATLQRNLPPGDGYGYRLLATDSRDLIAGFIAQNRVGVYQLDVSQLSEITTTRLGLSGSLVSLGDEVVVGRRAESAFALVSVPGFANVRVSLNNQEVGRTNARGSLFVPRLRPYESNQISIDQQDLPMSAEVVTLRMDVTPYLRSGMAVRFAVRDSLSGIAQFVDDSGAPIPAGATLNINGAPERVPIAERGEAFLTGLAAKNLIRITSGDRSCTITINYQRTNDPQPMLGVFKCELEK
jgi:outer membrane usher protein